MLRPAASGAGELHYAECGARIVDGAGRKAEGAPDLLERLDKDEVAVYCPTCWAAREFAPDGPASRDA